MKNLRQQNGVICGFCVFRAINSSGFSHGILLEIILLISIGLLSDYRLITVALLIYTIIPFKSRARLWIFAWFYQQIDDSISDFSFNNIFKIIFSKVFDDQLHVPNSNINCFLKYFIKIVVFLSFVWYFDCKYYTSTSNSRKTSYAIYNLIPFEHKPWK